jgi:hypothetical protein
MTRIFFPCAALTSPGGGPEGVGFAGDSLQVGEGVADVEGGIGGMVVNGGGCCVQPNDQPADKQDNEEDPGGEALESGHASNIIKK